jgi:hypothetical protein
MHSEPQRETSRNRLFPALSRDTNTTARPVSRRISLIRSMVDSLTRLQEWLRDRRYPILYVLFATLFLSIWHSRASHVFSFRAFPVFLALCSLSLIYGRFFIQRSPLSFRSTCGLSVQLLCGYFVLNTTIFLLSFLTPFGIATNVLIVAAGGLLLLVYSPKIAEDFRRPADCFPDFLCLVLSGAAATLWCTDALRPFVTQGAVTIYQTFPDSFFHSRVISSVAQAHDLKTMPVILMSDNPTPMYHYAMYITPAALSVFTKSGAYITFVSFLVPFGVVLTGLAAFSLAGSVWGRWPGVAATLAVTLLPDAYQQGFGTKWLSYQFFQHVAPNGLYGVACVAIAWMFVLDGCKVPRFTSILFGYAILIASIVYKAQFFVANAFLLMIYPCVFFRGLRIPWRLLSAVVLVSLFFFVVGLSQNVDRIPTLRLDGSALRAYASLLLARSEPDVFKSFYQTFLLEKQSNVIFAFYATRMLLLYTFGIWTAICLFTSFLLRARVKPAALLFPFLVIVNYLVMSLGLAMDTKAVGQPEELLHRPFVWAYFVVVAWSSAGAYILSFGNRSPTGNFARVLATIIAISSLSVPLVFGRNLQTLPHTHFDRYEGINSVPSGMVKACSYIRKHSQPGDIIQDSENDPRFWITGLADRQEFAVDYKLWAKIYSPPGLRERLKELANFKRMKNEQDLREFTRKSKISWYLLGPESKVDWPPTVLKKPVFRAGDYRVYHFPP